MRSLRIALCALALWAGGERASAQAAAPTPSTTPTPPTTPAPAPAVTETRQTIRGTEVSLWVPDGFRASDDFPGIGRAEDLTSVMVTELQVPLGIAAEAFSQQALEQRGFALQGTTKLVVGGRDATRYDAIQHIGGMNFRKWFLLLGDDAHSLLLTATTPSESEAQYRDTLVRVLDSARFGERSAPAPPKPLSFQVKESAPLRIVRTGDESLVLSETTPAAGHVVPLVTVGMSRALVEIANLADFARERLEQTEGLAKVAVESQSPRALASLEGQEIAAAALDSESGRAVKVRQILARDGNRYYLVQGIFDAEDAARLAPAFEAVAASFELRPTH